VSIKRVLCPKKERAADKLTAVVVFPTPPFWLVIAIVTDNFNLLAVEQYLIKKEKKYQEKNNKI